MILGIVLVLISLTANVWLWGHWSFEKSSGLTILLVVDTLFLLFILITPVVRLTKGTAISEIFFSWYLKMAFYLVMAMTIILAIASFYGIMVYLLPIKIILLIAYAFFNAKRKKMFSSR